MNADKNDERFESGADLSLAKIVTKTEDFEVRGETISVTYTVRQMPDGSEFSRVGVDDDPLDIAFKIYRERNDLLTPEEIVKWRKSIGGIGLNQRQLAAVLGIGEATLKRYEAGSLQSEAHENVIRLAMEPKNLVGLIERKPEALPPEHRAKIIAALKTGAAYKLSPSETAQSFARKSDASGETGFRKFDFERFRSAVLYFAKDGVVKTKLNKLLFFADFSNFMQSTLSITGLAYVKLGFGPVPDNYELLYGLLINSGDLEIEEVSLPGGEVFERYRARADSNVGLFENAELLTITKVQERFKGFTARAISDYSHDETAYKLTDDKECISYEHAFDMRPV